MFSVSNVMLLNVSVCNFVFVFIDPPCSNIAHCSTCVSSGECLHVQQHLRNVANVRILRLVAVQGFDPIRQNCKRLHTLLRVPELHLHNTDNET
jgi:hypothetical protein